MKLLGNTRELMIISENCHEEVESGIKYPLYETDYISGIRMIFQQAIGVEKWRCDNKGRFISDEKRNIFSFVGGRGTGKTTAMNEFCSILSNMNDLKQREWWVKHTLNEEEQQLLSNKKFYFHVLNPIDASLLTRKDDLFQLILANLYREFEEKMKVKTLHSYNDDPSVRKVLNDFMEISKLYRNGISYVDDDMEFISKLQYMKGSQQIQEKVAELIENLLSIQKEAECEYIVIAIDDLDLNLTHGYEILEQLQKYFSNERIIVLATLDYEQMQLVCEEHFLKEMSETSKIFQNGEYYRTLANDYMIKLFHLSQRMYMPEMQRISKETQIKLPKEVFKRTEKRMEYCSVKQFILLKIAELMKIYYDACGVKEHFCEPETVRNLVTYNEFLESFEEIDYKGLKPYENLKNTFDEKRNEEILRKYKKNHERFNADINVRMVQGLLNDEQKRVFEILNRRDLVRRARYFVCLKRTEQGFVFNNITGKKYAYGDLLEKIYNWGNENASGDYFIDKPFICCVLASFTSEMVCEYIKYRHNPNPDKRKKYEERLLGFFGESFGSEWIGKVFPEVNASTLNDILYQKEKKYHLYRRNIQQPQLNIQIHLDKLQKRNPKKTIVDCITEWLEKEEIIEILECVDMFFVRREGNEFKGITYDFSNERKNNNPGIKVKIGDHEESIKVYKDIKTLTITGKGENIILDIMGFVAKSMNYQKVKEELHTNIQVGLKEFLIEYFDVKDNSELIAEIEKVIKTKIVENSLFKNKEIENEIVFPYYNLDMSYNIFKRVRDNYKNKVIKEENLFEELVGFYKYIGELLAKEEENYWGKIEYLSIYNNCPYIKILDIWSKKNKIAKVLTGFFHNIFVEGDSEAEG